MGGRPPGFRRTDRPVGLFGGTLGKAESEPGRAEGRSVGAVGFDGGTVELC